jgi:hypothetical protein
MGRLSFTSLSASLRDFLCWSATEGARLFVRKGAVMERLWVRNGAVLAPFVKEMLAGGRVQLEAGGPRGGFETAPFVGRGGGGESWARCEL